MISKIVHPTDFSEQSIPALNSAHDLARQTGAKLIVCFIASPPLVAVGTVLTDPNKNEKRDVAKELEEHQPAESGVDRELRIMVAEQSTKVKTLLGFLEEMGGDLIILGMHKRSGVAGWLHTSITEEVVRRAACAVMVVKQHGFNYDFDKPEDSAADQDATDG